MIPGQVSPLPNTGAASSVDVIIWVGALILAVLLLGIVILLLRKRLFARDADDASGMLSELRRMHKSGELSTQEYDAARKALTVRVAGRTSAPQPAKPERQQPDPHRPGPDGELRAKPGFDLTGAPLPTPSPNDRGGQYDRKPPSA